MLEFSEHTEKIETQPWFHELPTWFQDGSRELLASLTDATPENEIELGKICAHFSDLLHRVFSEQPDLQEHQRIFRSVRLAIARTIRKYQRRNRNWKRRDFTDPDTAITAFRDIVSSYLDLPETAPEIESPEYQDITERLAALRPIDMTEMGIKIAFHPSTGTPAFRSVPEAVVQAFDDVYPIRAKLADKGIVVEDKAAIETREPAEQISGNNLLERIEGAILKKWGVDGEIPHLGTPAGVMFRLQICTLTAPRLRDEFGIDTLYYPPEQSRLSMPQVASLVFPSLHLSNWHFGPLCKLLGAEVVTSASSLDDDDWNYVANILSITRPHGRTYRRIARTILLLKLTGSTKLPPANSTEWQQVRYQLVTAQSGDFITFIRISRDLELYDREAHSSNRQWRGLLEALFPGIAAKKAQQEISANTSREACMQKFIGESEALPLPHTAEWVSFKIRILAMDGNAAKEVGVGNQVRTKKSSMQAFFASTFPDFSIKEWHYLPIGRSLIRELSTLSEEEIASCHREIDALLNTDDLSETTVRKIMRATLLLHTNCNPELPPETDPKYTEARAQIAQLGSSQLIVTRLHRIYYTLLPVDKKPSAGKWLRSLFPDLDIRSTATERKFVETRTILQRELKIPDAALSRESPLYTPARLKIAALTTRMLYNQYNINVRSHTTSELNAPEFLALVFPEFQIKAWWYTKFGKRLLRGIATLPESAIRSGTEEISALLDADTLEKEDLRHAIRMKVLSTCCGTVTIPAPGSPEWHTLRAQVASIRAGDTIFLRYWEELGLNGGGVHAEREIVCEFFPELSLTEWHFSFAARVLMRNSALAGEGEVTLYAKDAGRIKQLLRHRQTTNMSGNRFAHLGSLNQLLAYGDAALQELARFCIAQPMQYHPYLDEEEIRNQSFEILLEYLEQLEISGCERVSLQTLWESAVNHVRRQSYFQERFRPDRVYKTGEGVNIVEIAAAPASTKDAPDSLIAADMELISTIRATISTEQADLLEQFLSGELDEEDKSVSDLLDQLRQKDWS